MIVGIDMGGTHIDGVIIKDGNIIKTIKNPTNRNDLFETIWTTLKQLLDGNDKNQITRINLSTTISTNAIVENKVSKVGLIIQSGPGRNYDFTNVTENLGLISGYIDHRGKIVKDLNSQELLAYKQTFKDNDVEAVGVVTKFSTRNPSHEKRILELYEAEFDHITMGHSLSGKLNFLRRVNTSYLNAAVYKTFNDFAFNIEKALKQAGINAPVYILKADGGTMNLKMATKKPVETILSGPAASFMGLSAMFEENQDGILLDIGGTTTDIFFLVNGVQLFEPLGISIDNHKTLIRAIYSKSIGLGGDSYISVVNKEIKIGPKRMGKPLAFGGEYLTPTDAMVALDKMQAPFKEKSIKALKAMGSQLDMDVNQLAKYILEKMADIIYVNVIQTLDKINSKPVYTIKELLQDYQLSPKFINVIGGPAKILAPYLESKFNLKVKFPLQYEVANAIGAALAKPTMEINLHADTERAILSVSEVNLYQSIDRNYNLDKAIDQALAIIKSNTENINGEVEAEIVEANSYNMVKGYMSASKNIRVRAQVKPGLIYMLKGED